MTDNTNPAPSEGSIAADAHGDFRLPDYSIDPADQHLADAILNRDPVLDTPGSVSILGSVRLPDVPPVSALPPHLAEPIKARLAREGGLMSAKTERELVQNALYANSLEARIKAGPGSLLDGATHYDQEWFAVARDQRELDREYLDLSAKLTEIDHVRHDTDPRTGAKVEVTVHKVTGTDRQRMEGRLKELDLKAKALEVESRLRLQKALHQSVAARKDLLEKQEEEAEVERRSQEGVREARIASRVAKRVAIRSAEVRR